MTRNSNRFRGGFTGSGFHIQTPIGKINPKDIPGLKKPIENIEKIGKAQGIDIGKVLPHIKTYTEILAKTVTKHKVGQDIFVSVVDHAMDSLSNSGNSKIPLAHNNENIGSINSGSYITRTNCHVGQPPGRRIAKAYQGAYHGSNRITLEDTERDRISHKQRKKLIGSCGFNQKGYDIFLDDTYLTIADLKELCEWEYYKKLIQKEKSFYKKRTQERAEGEVHIFDNIEETPNPTNATNATKSTKLKKAAYEEIRYVTQYYAGITKIVTKLKIRNIMPVYGVHVVVHLCQQKNPLEPTETEDLYTDLVNLSLSGSEGIRKDKIYSHYSDNKGYRFKAQINTALDANIKHTDAFKDSTKIIKSWGRVLPENAQWHLKITEHLGDGILLNHLEKVKTNVDSEKAPMNYFFIIEYFGDNRASISRKKDNDVFHGYSPCSISYRYKQDVHFVVNLNEKDKPIVLPSPDKDGNFEDESLGKEFYPTRRGYFNVGFSDININNPRGQGKFNLDFASDIATTTAASKFADVLKDLGIKTTNFTEDDYLFNGDPNDEDIDQEPHHDPPGGDDNENNGNNGNEEEDEERTVTP